MFRFHRTNRLHRWSLGISTILANGIMWLFSLSCIFPLIWMLSSSFKEPTEFNADIIALPHSFYLGNFEAILLNTGLPRYMLNSLYVTFCSLFGVLVLGFITGYLMGRFSFKGKKGLSFYYLLGMLIPVHALMVPMYVLFKNFGLSNQWYTLIIPYIAFGLPVTIFLVQSYVQSLPISMEEAACIDGSSFTGTMIKIVLPMCLPVLATIGIIEFFNNWNEFSFALILINDESLRTLPLGISVLNGQYSSNYPKIIAGMLLALAPASLIYFMFSKQIIKGMVTGAVKG